MGSLADRSPATEHGLGRRGTVLVLLVALPLIGAVAFAVALGPIAHVWGVCADDTGLTPGLEILFGVLPTLFLVSCAAFALTLFVTFLLRRPLRILGASLTATLALVIAMTWYVPALGESDPIYQAPVSSDCGPNGIPHWWPDWLPH